MTTHKLWEISTSSTFINIGNIALSIFLVSVENTSTHLISSDLAQAWATAISILINVVISKIKCGGKQHFFCSDTYTP